jgi:hypothetical protein
MTKIDWENITNYIESVGPTDTTFPFKKTQSSVKVTASGATSNIIYTIGGQSGTLTPGQSITVTGSIISMTLRSASGQQPFQVWAVEGATEKNEQDINFTLQKIPFVYNSDIGLRRWRAELAKVKQDTNKIINISCVGDSITQGAGSDSVISNWQDKGWRGQLNSYFASKFNDVGKGFRPCYSYDSANTYNPWTYSGNWTDLTTAYGVMSFCKKSNSQNDTATISFNGTGVGVVMAKNTNCGNMDFLIDGVSHPYNAYSTTVISASTYEITGLTAGDHTLVIKNNAPGIVFYLIGIYEIKGSKGVRVNMLGKSAMTITYAMQREDQLQAEIDIWNPKLTIIGMCANGGMDTATWKSRMQTLITRALQYGDVLLTTWGLQQDTTYTPSYVAATRELAKENNCALLDIYDRWGSDYNYANTTLGLIYDTIHPNIYGHQDICDAIIKTLVEV